MSIAIVAPSPVDSSLSNMHCEPTHISVVLASVVQPTGGTDGVADPYEYVSLAKNKWGQGGGLWGEAVCPGS